MSASTPETTESPAPTPAPSVPAQARRGIPAAVAVVIVLLALSAGGAVLYKFWIGLEQAGKGQKVALDEKPSDYGNGGGGTRRVTRVMGGNPVRTGIVRVPQGMEGPDYVQPRPQGNGIEVKAHHSRIMFTAVANPGANQPAFRIIAESMEPDFVSPEARTMLTIRARATTEDAVAKQINLTADQKTKLISVPRGVYYVVPPATQKELIALATEWQGAADKAASSAKLIAAGIKLEQELAGPTKKSIEDRTAQIKMILSADQIKAFEDMGKAK